MQIVCPSCDAINRVPLQRLQADSLCGKCHEPMFIGQSIDLPDQRMRRHLQHSDIPILVDFWAAWCGPCKMLSPLVDETAKELEPRLRLIKLDTVKEPGITLKYGVRGLPTLLFFERGIEVDRVSGVMDFANLLAWIRAHM